MSLPPVALRTKRFPPAIGANTHRLVAHMAECDLNYERLMSLFPKVREEVALHLAAGGKRQKASNRG